jgi:zinc and cadmium transporter
MGAEWLYAIISVLIVSLVSLVGAISLPFKTEKLKTILIYVLAFSAGAMLGDAFIHLMPDAVSKYGATLEVGLFVLSGIAFSFILEKLIHWRHCHMPITKDHVHSFALMNMVGDVIHNFIDGIIIGVSYLAGIQIGIATTTAVVIHEIPHEMANFGVLIHGGFSKMKALLYNFLTALVAIVGTVAALIIGSKTANLTMFFVPFTMGTFIYIAGADLIPELHKETAPLKSIFQFIFFALGIALMALLLAVG